VYNLLLAVLLTFTSILMLMHIVIQVSEMLVFPIEPQYIEMCHSLFDAWNTSLRYLHPLVLCCKEYDRIEIYLQYKCRYLNQCSRCVSDTLKVDRLETHITF
jgi:hypothetical protein